MTGWNATASEESTVPKRPEESLKEKAPASPGAKTAILTGMTEPAGKTISPQAIRTKAREFSPGLSSILEYLDISSKLVHVPLPNISKIKLVSDLEAFWYS